MKINKIFAVKWSFISSEIYRNLTAQNEWKTNRQTVRDSLMQFDAHFLTFFLSVRENDKKIMSLNFFFCFFEEF